VVRLRALQTLDKVNAPGKKRRSALLAMPYHEGIHNIHEVAEIHGADMAGGRRLGRINYNGAESVMNRQPSAPMSEDGRADLPISPLPTAIPRGNGVKEIVRAPSG